MTNVQVNADANDMMGFMSTPGYTNSFWSCCTDPLTCCSVMCCPCLVVGYISGKVHKGGAFDVPACLCSGIGSYRIRRKVQGMYGITESEDSSVCAITCCGLCAVTQDVREYNKRQGVTAPSGQPQMSTN